MKNQLILIALLSLWIIIFNLIVSNSNVVSYYEIYEIKINTYMYYMEFDSIESVSKFYAVLENDYECEIDAQNTYIMNNIIDQIENSKYTYYTRINTRTNMCTVPVLHSYVLYEKFMLALSFGTTTIIFIFMFYNLVIKFVDFITRLNEHRIQSYTKCESDEPGIIELEQNQLFNSI